MRLVDNDANHVAGIARRGEQVVLKRLWGHVKYALGLPLVVADAAARLPGKFNRSVPRKATDRMARLLLLRDERPRRRHKYYLA